VAALAIALQLVAPCASAQQPSDNPIEPDRPDVTNGTHIVDTGLLQVEMGGIFTRTAPGQQAFGSPFTARLGVFSWLEVRFGGDGVLSQADPTTSATGFGNLQAGAKLRLWDGPGGVPVLSILPTVNIPTASASKNLGSGDADYTLALLTGRDIGRRGHIDVNYGIGAIGSGGGAPHFVQHAASVSASLAATPKWNPYVEGFWFSRQDPGGGPTTALDGGAIYTVSPRFALDGGLQAGLTAAAPDFAAFAGVSIVVGDIIGGHGVHSRQRHAVRGIPKKSGGTPRK
jgi:hypothetical protein